MDHSRRFPAEDIARDMDNILRLGFSRREQAAPPPPSRPVTRKRDWEAALAAIYHAAETMKATETRAVEIEARSLDLVERALKELKLSDSRLQAAEAAGHAAAVRAREAEARAREAEDWLARLHDTIVQQFIEGRGDQRCRSIAAA